MQPFQLAPYRDEERARRTRDELIEHLKKNRKEAAQALGREDFTDEDVVRLVEETISKNLSLPTYVNDTYQVVVEEVEAAVDGWPQMVHLSIKRRDREIIRDWRELQEIKNLLVGRENEGLEVFPAESRLVDTANQYHLWVFKDPQVRLPFGFQQRMVTDDTLSTAKQRPRGA